MTMTLGFDAFEYLSAILDANGARDVIDAIAKHAPDKPIRVAHLAGTAYNVEEIDRDGKRTEPADLEAIREAIVKVDGFIDWPNANAPEGVPPLILPGSGWPFNALFAEDAIAKLIKADWLFEKMFGTDEARSYFDSRGRKMLPIAEKHRLLLVFR